MQNLKLLRNLKIIFICTTLLFPFLNYKSVYSEGVIDSKFDLKSIQEDFYIIGPGDILNIVFLDVKDISGEVKVLNDGNIQIPLFGDIQVSGLTLSEATTKVREIIQQHQQHLLTKLMDIQQKLMALGILKRT